MRRPWSIIDRTLIQEALPPMAIGFLTYTFILLTKNFFDFAELIIRRGLGIGLVGRLLGLSLPHIIVLTLPMALLFGILIAAGRLAADSELIAWRSCGVPLVRLYRPIFYLSFAAALVNLWMMVSVLPWGNRLLQSLKLEIMTSALSAKVEPRVFYEQFEEKVLYVQDQGQGQVWRGLFLADTSDLQSQKIVLAKEGEIDVDRANDRLWLVLRQASTHVVDVRDPDKYLISVNREQRIVLRDQFEVSERSKISFSKSLREMTLLELFAVMESNREANSESHRTALVEIHKKFAIPIACLVFGLVALPLGVSSQRGGKSSGFAMSIGIILGYYLLISNGEDLARAGHLPPAVAMWTPNLFLGVLGIVLFRRRNADRPMHFLPSSWRRRLEPYLIRIQEIRPTRAGLAKTGRAMLWRRRERSRDKDKPVRVVIRLPRYTLRFPNLIDRYILREFGKIFLLVAGSVVTLYVIVDYSDKVQEISKNSASFDVVFAYYRYLLPQIFYDSLPISVLVSTLICFGVFAKHNEVTAFKAHAISLYRVALPIVIFGIAMSGLAYALADFVLPYSNQRVHEFKDIINGNLTPRTYRRADRQWIFGHGSWLYNYLNYDPGTKSMQRLSVFDFNRDLTLRRRVFAERAVWAGDGWLLENGWVRDFAENGRQRYKRFPGQLKLGYPEDPSYFEHDLKTPDQMNVGEMHRYIEELQASGYDPPVLRVKFYQKTAFPFVALVMALIAVPFSFRAGKKGALYGVGLAIILGMGFTATLALFTKLGEVGALPAFLAAWSANIIFAIFAVYLTLRIET